MQNSRINYSKQTRLLALVSIIAASVLLPFVTSLAQRKSKQAPPKVTGISAKKTGNGHVISLAADGALSGVQTWQDPNGKFHLILPGSGTSPVKGMPPGVKVRRVGDSLEVEVQSKSGSNVTVQPRFNRLDLVVNGGVDENAGADAEDSTARTSPATPRDDARAANAATRAARVPNALRSQKEAASPDQVPSQSLGGPSLNMPLTSMPVAKNSTTVTNTIVSEPQPAATTPATQTAQPAAPQHNSAEPTEADEVGSGFSIFYSGWWITILLVSVLVGLVMWRRREKAGWEDIENEQTTAVAPVNQTLVNSIVKDRRRDERRKSGRKGGRRSSDEKERERTLSSAEIVEPHEQMVGMVVGATATPVAPALFGAYRVDQEVFKLILGQAHRMDVLASRAPDDRRAMEASLLKAMRSPETDEDGRRRARQALEEYGFVARQSAALLLAQDPCERAAAARMLGEVGAAVSLQFLLEALYDVEAIVRAQAVESIGALKLPSAIGALLDIAHRYPDMPNSIMSNALNACSIDNLDFFDSVPSSPALLSFNPDEPFSAEINQLEPAAAFERLPESTEDESLVDTLAHLQSGDAEARAAAAQTLALYRVGRCVSALKLVTASDPEPAVRAAAVSSLGAIDHESVFSAVLVALADEARDVRAAAARSLSRLSFDRADAYVRVIETADAEELGDVARACIKTGMAAQALDRLASEDRRQAYEAFSLLSLLAKANEAQPILEALEKHADLNVCLAAVQLLSVSGQPEIAGRLRLLAVREGMPEEVRTALMEVVYKMDEMQPV